MAIISGVDIGKTFSEMIEKTPEIKDKSWTISQINFGSIAGLNKKVTFYAKNENNKNVDFSMDYRESSEISKESYLDAIAKLVWKIVDLTQ